MKVIRYQDGEKCAVSLADGVVVFPGRLADELQSVIDAAIDQGERKAKCAIRDALGVTDAIEDMANNIHHTIQPSY